MKTNINSKFYCLVRKIFLHKPFLSFLCENIAQIKNTKINITKVVAVFVLFVTSAATAQVTKSIFYTDSGSKIGRASCRERVYVLV